MIDAQKADEDLEKMMFSGNQFLKQNLLKL